MIKQSLEGNEGVRQKDNFFFALSGGREFQIKQKVNAIIEQCLLYPKSSKGANFYIKSGREMGSVAHGEIRIKKILWGMNQDRNKC